MSITNGRQIIDKAMVEKEAIASVVKAIVGGVKDDLQRARAEFAEQIDLLRREKRVASQAVNTVTGDMTVVDTEPIAKSLDRMEVGRASDALHYVKSLAVVKDLVDAVNNLPVPQVSTPVSLDLSPITELLEVMREDVHADRAIIAELREDASANRDLVKQLAQVMSGYVAAFKGLSEELTEQRKVTRQLIEMLKIKREKKSVRVEFDASGNATMSEE